MPLLCILSPIAALYFPYVVIGALALNFIGRIIYMLSYEKRALGFVMTLLCSLVLVIFAFWASFNVISRGLEMYDSEQQSITEWNSNAAENTTPANTPAEPESAADPAPAAEPEAAA